MHEDAISKNSSHFAKIRVKKNNPADLSVQDRDLYIGIGYAIVMLSSKYTSCVVCNSSTPSLNGL